MGSNLCRAHGNAEEDEVLYLVFLLAPHEKASFTGMGLTTAQMQPCEQYPEGVVKCLGHSHFGL